MGKDERALLALFGEPDLDVREGHARKYQFAGPFCVLDVYLYPTRARLARVVTYVEARDLKGADLHRASCIAALGRRPAAGQGHNSTSPFPQAERPRLHRHSPRACRAKALGPQPTKGPRPHTPN